MLGFNVRSIRDKLEALAREANRYTLLKLTTGIPRCDVGVDNLADLVPVAPVGSQWRWVDYERTMRASATRHMKRSCASGCRSQCKAEECMITLKVIPSD